MKDMSNPHIVKQDTYTVVVPDNVGPELKTMCMVEQVMEHASLTTESRHRIAVWFDNRYRDWTGESDG